MSSSELLNSSEQLSEDCEPQAPQSSQRPRRNGAGSRLPVLLAAEKGVPLKTLQTVQQVEEGLEDSRDDGPDSDSESHSGMNEGGEYETSCCICTTSLSTNDTKVTCKGTQVAQAQVLTSNPEKPPMQVASSQTTPQAEAGNPFPPYETLLEAHRGLEASLHKLEVSHKQECKELKMYNLQLEERIVSLEKEISILKNKLSSGVVCSTINSQQHANSSEKIAAATYAQALTGQNYKQRIFKPNPASGGEPTQIASRIVRTPRRRERSSNRQQTSRTHLSLTSSNYRILWGTKLATKVSEVQVITSLVPNEDPSGISVKKSVKRLADKSKWWFTILASHDILNTLDSTWTRLENTLQWKLQHSLRRPELSDDGDQESIVRDSHSINTNNNEGCTQKTESVNIDGLVPGTGAPLLWNLVMKQ